MSSFPTLSLSRPVGHSSQLLPGLDQDQTHSHSPSRPLFPAATCSSTPTTQFLHKMTDITGKLTRLSRTFFTLPSSLLFFLQREDIQDFHSSRFSLRFFSSPSSIFLHVLFFSLLFPTPQVPSRLSSSSSPCTSCSSVHTPSLASHSSSGGSSTTGSCTTCLCGPASPGTRLPSFPT